MVRTTGWYWKEGIFIMKPIKVIKKLVHENPNDMQLGELVRQYIREQYGWEKIKTKSGHGPVNQ